MPEIENPHARRIIEIAGNLPEGRKVWEPPEEETTPIDVETLESHLSGIQTITMALLAPFIAIAALFGFTMGSANRG